MLSLQYPWFLILLVPLAVALYAAWYRKPPTITVPGIKTFRDSAGNRGKRVSPRKWVPFLLYAVAGLLIVLALARPREGLEEIRSRAEGIDIILALDLSGSMSAIDVPGYKSNDRIEAALRSGRLQNRLETAKAEIRKFILARPNDRIGLVVFADLPFVACPPTLDHGFLIARMEGLKPGSIGSNTGIASPLASAVKRLKDSEAKSRVIVLFTDGVNNVKNQVTPREAAKIADTFKITVYTVGIGSGNALFPAQSVFGQTVYQRAAGEFDEPLLKDIAKLTGGKYYHAADADGMNAAMKEIDKLEKTSAEQPVTINWRELYPQLCWWAVAALMLALLMQNTVYVKVP